MGLLTDDNIKQSKINYVNIDSVSGKFTCNNNIYPGIEGHFLGFNSHEFEFKNKQMKKIAIFISDNEDIYDIQIGFYSWISLGILNCLSNINLKDGGKLKLIAFKKDAFNRILVYWNGKNIGWKWSHVDLKFPSTYKEEHRDKCIDKLFSKFYADNPFDPKQPFLVQEDSEKETGKSSLMDDDIPF